MNTFYVTITVLQSFKPMPIVLQQWVLYSNNAYCFLTILNYFPTVRKFLCFSHKTILTHSRSRVVLKLLKAAASEKRRFNVFVTESAPDQSGQVERLPHFTTQKFTAKNSHPFIVFFIYSLKMHEQLKEAGIPSTVILDNAVG